MNRYWDKTQQERAAMTREQVQAYLDVELMEQGVAKVDPPQLQEVVAVDLEKVVYFQVSYKGEYGDRTDTDILFETVEQARQFIELCPLRRDSRYEYGWDHKYAIPMREMAIKKIELPSESAVANMASVLKRNKAAEEANTKARNAYNKAIKAVEEATAGVWHDWEECREKERQAAKIYATLDEYIRLCDGNRETALRFLGKLYDSEQIAEAFAWRGEEPPVFAEV
jgi:hypothetical protein